MAVVVVTPRGWSWTTWSAWYGRLVDRDRCVWCLDHWSGGPAICDGCWEARRRADAIAWRRDVVGLM